MSLFKKKIPRKGTFGNLPIIKGNAKVNSKYNMETVCKIILTEILKFPNIELQVVTDDRLVKKFDTETVEVQAILDSLPMPHTYCLHLRGTLNMSILSIICHEMVHLKQYESGDLKLKGTTFYGKGKDYSNIDYGSRPGESEARREQIDIEKQVKKLYYE